MSYRHTSRQNIRWAPALPPAPRRQHPAGWQPASAARRHELALEEARRERRYLQLAPGHIVVHENVPWRVLAIDERPDDLWGEKYERQLVAELAAWERHGRGDKPERATWRGRPVMVQVVPVADPKAKPVHLRAPGSHQWPVLPEHYSVCAACGELPPCRHELAEQEADRIAARADVLMAIPPGNCLACGETITSRQNATRFPGPNLWRPDLGDNTARFHDRGRRHHRPDQPASPRKGNPVTTTHTPLRALTVRQPWADAITHGTSHGRKLIENRTRPAPAKHHDTRILIHAGATYDLMSRFLIHRDDLAAWPDERKALIATATLTGSHPETDRCCAPWGEYDAHHWELADVTPLPRPVPTPGALGFWTPTPDVLTAVADQIGATR